MIVLGVTLIEVLLVLAFVSLLMVLAIRYYQQAVNHSYANSALEMVSSITVAASSLQSTNNTYNPVSTSAIQPLMPNGSLTTPWGGQMSIVGSWNNGYMITITNIPQGVCLLIESHLATNPDFKNDIGEQGACQMSSNNTLWYIYPRQ